MFMKIGEEQSVFEAKFTREEIARQERELIFDEFTRKDALRLGRIMLDKSEELHMPFAFMIEMNGVVVLQYLPEGTGAFNEAWMRKKLRTVQMTGISTMLFWTGMEARGLKRSTEEMLPVSDIVPCGGGFPIRLKNGTVIGAAAVSGPGDQNDHLFVTECMRALLQEKTERTAK